MELLEGKKFWILWEFWGKKWWHHRNKYNILRERFWLYGATVTDFKWPYIKLVFACITAFLSNFMTFFLIKSQPHSVNITSCNTVRRVGHCEELLDLLSLCSCLRCVFLSKAHLMCWTDSPSIENCSFTLHRGDAVTSEAARDSVVPSAYVRVMFVFGKSCSVISNTWTPTPTWPVLVSVHVAWEDTRRLKYFGYLSYFLTSIVIISVYFWMLINVSVECK